MNVSFSTDLFTMTNTSRKRGYVPKFLHNKDAKKKKFNNDKLQRVENSKQKFGKSKFTKSKTGSKMGDRRSDRPKHKTRKSK